MDQADGPPGCDIIFDVPDEFQSFLLVPYFNIYHFNLFF